MGTDRFLEYEGPCNCGKGSYKINNCTPDHSWPTSTPFWFEASIRCDNCKEKYNLIQQGRNFVLIERAELNERESHRKKAYDLANNFMKQEKTQLTLELLVSLLDSQPSMAAVHRQLSKFGLEHSSIGTFRKGWSGGKDWVNRYISAYKIPAVLELLEKDDVEMLERIKQINDLLEEADKPLTPIGKPVYTSSKEG